MATKKQKQNSDVHKKEHEEYYKYGYDELKINELEYLTINEYCDTRECIEWMIRKPDLINKIKKDFHTDIGQSPLLQAVLSGRQSLVTALLMRGAKPQPCDSDYLKHKIDSRDSLIKEYSIETIEQLIVLGYDVNMSINESGRTMLYYASKAGYTEMVDMLIKFGARHDIATWGNIQPLDVALNSTPRSKKSDEEYGMYRYRAYSDNEKKFTSDHNKCAILLLKAGADLFHKCVSGISSPIRELDERHIPFIEKVIEMGLMEKVCQKLDEETKRNSFSNWYSLLSGREEFAISNGLKMFKLMEPYLSKKPKRIHYYFHYVVKNDDDEDYKMVNYFLEKGADINYKIKGETILFNLASQNDINGLKHFISKGANPKLRDDKGKRFIDYMFNYHDPFECSDYECECDWSDNPYGERQTCRHYVDSDSEEYGCSCSGWDPNRENASYEWSKNKSKEKAKEVKQKRDDHWKEFIELSQY